jgi:hypothetical protein
MRPLLRPAFSSLREIAGTALPLIVLALLLLGLAYWVLDPTPPRHVVLATGVEQGAYDEFGKRYAQALARHGIQVELRRTAGAAENLELLRTPGSGVELAFVQGGAGAPDDEHADDPLYSLGSMFYEPVWLFYREDAARRLLKAPVLESLSQLPGWRLNIGAAGSGVPNMMLLLIEANRIDAGTLTLLREPQTPATVALLEGRIDALVFASAPESLMVQMLLQTPGVRLFHFSQADAYSRRFGFLSAVTLPRGVVDLAANVPAEDVRLIAPTASLVVRDSLHPALAQLFVQAAQQVHGSPGWFQRKGDFPNARDNERALAPEAQRFYREGAPLLQRYLPFWLANLIDRMWVVLLSIVAVLIPLSRVVPPLYRLRVRSRIFRWYRQLRQIEDDAEEKGADRAELIKQLERLDAKASRIKVPLAYTDELYALRQHIDFLQTRLKA